MDTTNNAATETLAQVGGTFKTREGAQKCLDREMTSGAYAREKFQILPVGNRFRLYYPRGA